MWTVGVVALWAPIERCAGQSQDPDGGKQNPHHLPCQIKNAHLTLVGAGMLVNPPAISAQFALERPRRG